jgi:hypothetical protein
MNREFAEGAESGHLPKGAAQNSCSNGTTGGGTLLLVQMIHYLHLRRMSPSELNAKRESQKIAIIDLLNFEDGVTSVGIPGAIRIDPIRLRSR